MPYSLDNKPDQIKGLPKHAQEIWIAAYNSAYEQHDGNEEKSAKIAWSAVKNKYKKVDGKWVKKTSAAMHGVSFFELIDKVYTSIRNVFRNADGWDYYSICIQDVSLTEVVISDELGRNLSIPYTVSKDGVVLLNLSDIKPVQKAWTDLSAAIGFTANQKDKTGTTWEIICLSAGKSGNDWKLSAAVLKAATNLFNSIPVFARADDEHCQDKARSVKNIVGDISGAKYVASKGVIGTLTIHPDAQWLKTKMLSLWASGKLQGDNPLFAYSFVGSGTSEYDENDGYFDITKLTSVTSVDVVVQPATKTATLKLVAGMVNNTNLTRRSGMDRLIAFIKKHAPDLHAQVDLANPDETQVQEFFAQAEKIVDDKMLAAAKAGGNNDGVDVEAKAKEEKEKKEKELAAAKTTPSVNDELAQRVQALECEKLLNKHLTAAVQLTEPLKASLRKQFEGNIFKEDALTGAIAGYLDVLATLSNSGDIDGHGVSRTHVGPDREEKLQAALDSFFSKEPAKDGTSYPKSFRDLYVEITGDSTISGQQGENVDLRKFTAALNSGSWTQILGDSITRQMQKEYNMPGLQDWRKIVSEITAPKDFRTNRRMQLGGYGSLPAVGEGGSYENMGSPTDRESTYAVGKKGGLEELTIEMVANDDVGAIRRIPVKLARAAANTLYRTVFDIVKNNTLTVDGTVIFHADHSNLGAAALDATTLLAGKKAMMQQLAYGSTTEYLGTLPKKLLIPADLEDTAFRLTTGRAMIGATNNAATEPNIHTTYGLDYILVPYWTDANDWVLVCDPKDVPTIEVGFFNGVEEPELFVQDMPNVGSLFSADKITYKIRHIYGVCVLDYRGMYKAIVA